MTKASQSSRAAVGSCAAIRMRRKKIKSFFRRRVRRKNTLRGASVESFATRGPRRSPAKRVRWGEEAQRSERRLPLCGGRRDTELVPTSRRAQRIPFGGKGVSLFRQSQVSLRRKAEGDLFCALPSIPPEKRGWGICAAAESCSRAGERRLNYSLSSRRVRSAS